MDVSRTAWSGAIAEVAKMPGVAARLAAAHVDDGAGRCCGCTTPGRGTPQDHWPCGLISLATAALQLQERAAARQAAAQEAAAREAAAARQRPDDTSEAGVAATPTGGALVQLGTVRQARGWPAAAANS